MRQCTCAKMVVGCMGLLLSSLVLADVGVSESNRAGQQTSSEWEMAKKAVRSGDKKQLEHIIESRGDIVNKVDGYFTLLGIAASKGDYGIVQELVKNGADPDIADGSALYHAVPGTLESYNKKDIEERLKIVLYLIDKGASLNHETPESNSGVSVSEALIMGFCDKNNFPEYSAEFLRSHGFEYSVVSRYRHNYEHIATLTKDEFSNSGKGKECVDFMFRATSGKGVESYFVE
ncbi:ankyrin repeat domain-containing protein [Halomonas eurihalina]|uniref:Ankyrin repeat domain-containing protein n=1 Tax=Halomonas eurihalina TaxID=42566 RepID=A0A5D9D638_HALER|nr:ankyrin repeat domain-containing protein [Halomonas eurihalina]MDR5859692.1 ankyrin repeat domain-containing protein [Halomonas eurihalina]TZG39147.1 ankyrin repeat domain-containing protein [Halomonas eurihalina]